MKNKNADKLTLCFIFGSSLFIAKINSENSINFSPIVFYCYPVIVHLFELKLI